MKPEQWRRIENLYNQAMELEESQRASFLREVCADDDGLRQELEALLAREPQVASFLEKPALREIAPGFAVDESGPPAPGTKIGSYRIEAPIGAGGMGTVYRAQDTKLNRRVAIKFLSDNLADAGARRRFQQEARMASALNHPHILTVHDAGEFGGRQYIVTEFVDGGTLNDWAKAEKRTWRQIVELMTGVADGLVAAHEAGILHRDIKPANILVARNRYAKLADFGLAKLADNTHVDPTGTLTEGRTKPGMIIGTIAYMSPEQCSGKNLDNRSDIFSFGTVLYELLGGRRPFEGATDLELLKTIVHGEPPPLGGQFPPELRVVVEKALEKNPEERYQSARELLLDLKRAQRLKTSEAPAYQPEGKPPWIRRAAGPVFAGLLLLAGGVGLSYLMKPSPLVTSPSEYVQLTDFTDSAVAPSLSPDGRMMAFKRGEDSFLSPGQIYVKLLPNGEPEQLTTTAGKVFAPVFTPDGSRIAYSLITSGSWDTWTVPVLGGQPTRLLPNATGLTWITDQLVLFSEIKTGLHMGIVTATEGRSNSREIYIQPNEHAMAHYSYTSPDRRSVLVVEMTGAHAFTQPCRLVPFDGSSSGRQVGPQGNCTSAAWSPDGEWMYFGATVDGSSHLWRQKFPDGKPEQITFGPLEEEGIAVAPDGRSLVTSVGTRRSAIWIHDKAGERAISSEGHALAPRLSRDGTRVLFLLVRDWWLSARGWMAASAELRSVDLASGKSDRVLTGFSATDYDISPDEKEVVFTTTDSEGGSQIWLAALDRRTPPRQIAQSGDQVSFGADGDIVFRSREEKTNVLARIKKDGSGRERISAAPVLNKYGVSPDGKWAVIQSPESDKAGSAAFVVPLSGGAPQKICGGFQAFWSSDGRFFYYQPSPGKTLAIPVPAGKSLPDLPCSGISAAAAEGVVPGATVLEHTLVSPGPDPSTYVFTRTDNQRNLFRIPLH